MKTCVAVTFFFGLVFVISADQHLDCDELGFEDVTAPTAGTSLRYCQTDAEQCCTNSYFNDRYGEISDMIRGEIRAELNNQIGSLGEVVDGMENYLREVFVPEFSRSFCSGLLTSSQCDDAISGAERELLDHLYINEDEETDSMVILDENSGFSSARVVSRYLSDSVNGIEENYLASRVDSEISQDQFTCLLEEIRAPPDEERYVYDNLTQIRRSFTALRRLRNHVNLTILPDIVAIRPTNSCITSFIDARCQACMEDIPDNCQGACNALVYGCLAPFREGLEGQFNLLWSITDQILTITNEMLPVVRSLRNLAYSININNAEAVERLAEACGITVTTDGGTTDDDSNGGTTDDDSDGGTTDDDSNGGTADDDDNTASNSTADRLPEFVSEIANRLLNSGAFNDTEPGICSFYENVNCWNGTANVTTNNVIFNDRTVAGQSNNPLAEYNVTNLQDFANSFDMFVTGFLRSPYFLDVAPEDLVLPFNTTNGTGGDGNDDSAGVVNIAGYWLLLATLMFGLLINNYYY